MIGPVSDTRTVASLFEGWQETMVWSCLQGVMGQVYAPAGEKPKSALAMLGDFWFFAGEPSEDLVRFCPAPRPFAILVPQHPGWEPVIRTVYGDRAAKRTRYATRKEEAAFDRARLEGFVRDLGEEYTLQPLSEPLYRQCQAQGWSRDLVSQYPSWAAYSRLGLGVAVTRKGELLAGASSYSAYRGGIEIEVDTRPDCRRRGLAQAACASLILACLDRGLYPSWDAQNPGSLALAETLGYAFSHTYPAYEVTESFFHFPP